MWGWLLNIFITISERVFLDWYERAKTAQGAKEALDRAKTAKDVRSGPELPDDKLHYRD
jgi:hypothetical protein